MFHFFLRYYVFGVTLQLIEKKRGGQRQEAVNEKAGKLLRLTEHFAGEIYLIKVRSVQ
jgi:hypothetical protein